MHFRTACTTSDGCTVGYRASLVAARPANPARPGGSGNAVVALLRVEAASRRCLEVALEQVRERHHTLVFHDEELVVDVVLRERQQRVRSLLPHPRRAVLQQPHERLYSSGPRYRGLAVGVVRREVSQRECRGALHQVTFQTLDERRDSPRAHDGSLNLFSACRKDPEGQCGLLLRQHAAGRQEADERHDGVGEGVGHLAVRVLPGEALKEAGGHHQGWRVVVDQELDEWRDGARPRNRHLVASVVDGEVVEHCGCDHSDPRNRVFKEPYQGANRACLRNRQLVAPVDLPGASDQVPQRPRRLLPHVWLCVLQQVDERDERAGLHNGHLVFGALNRQIPQREGGTLSRISSS
mmetsp:Transcript_108798/g.306600  ORF Transcript_108798/g.306600 Transcript_108798/m.306600 type:complete len:352 (-) Transcript_108798:1501-2556(-)